MSKKRKKLFIILGVSLLSLAVLYVSFWYFLCAKRYADYQEGFPPAADPKIKLYIDEEGYQYSAKQPSIIEFYSNLAIGSKDDKYIMIIWPDIFDDDKFKYGVMITNNNESVQIMLKDSTHAEEEANQYIVDENQVEIQKLVDKANNVWDLGLE